jgi:hypothetical protein
MFSNGTSVFFNQPKKEREETKPVVADIDGDPFVDKACKPPYSGAVEKQPN